MNANPVHIGDGVYASFDGYHVVLETVPGNIIYLEDEVWDNLVEYVKRHAWNAEAEHEPSDPTEL